METLESSHPTNGGSRNPSKATLPSKQISLLASVRSLDEAQLVWDSSVSILDFKNPSEGSLGSPSVELLRSFLNWLRRRNMEDGTRKAVPSLSLAAGELHSKQGSLHEDFPAEVLSKFQFAKVGMSSCRGIDWKTKWSKFFSGSPVHPVMACYLDYERCDAVDLDSCLTFASEQDSCQFMLLDTFDKSRDLFASISPEQLAGVVQTANKFGLRVVVAGSVDRDNLIHVVSARPDAIGVRGAICAGDRESQVCSKKLKALIDSLSEANASQ